MGLFESSLRDFRARCWLRKVLECPKTGVRELRDVSEVPKGIPRTFLA